MPSSGHSIRTPSYFLKTAFWLFLGAFLAAFAIKVFLIPNQLIDGGVVGLAMIGSFLFGKQLLPYFLLLFNLPFVFLAFKLIGRTFVIQMLIAVVFFALCLAFFDLAPQWFDIDPVEFHGETLEVIVVGGFIMGVGVGLIIRKGGSTDGTEILAIIINRKKGFTVGQVILFVNIFVFAVAGFAYQNWHTAFLSLLTYVVASKIIDFVIVGLDETKSVMIISTKPQQLANVLMEELGIGLTVMYGRGGYSGDDREILYIIVERLQLAELKEIIHREDPAAFVAIENLHEVINGRINTAIVKNGDQNQIS